MKIKLGRLPVFHLIVVFVCSLPLISHAALVIDGDTSGVPGGTVSLTIQLDEALAADIDELTLALQFDDGVLQGQSADAGPLLAGGLFSANAAAGMATQSYLATLTELGPGLLATWTFVIDAGAVAQTTNVLATLQTFVIDEQLTAELASASFGVAVVPLPPALVLMGGGLGLLAARRRARASLR